MQSQRAPLFREEDACGSPAITSRWARPWGLRVTRKPKSKPLAETNQNSGMDLGNDQTAMSETKPDSDTGMETPINVEKTSGGAPQTILKPDGPVTATATGMQLIKIRSERPIKSVPIHNVYKRDVPVEMIKSAITDFKLQTTKNQLESPIKLGTVTWMKGIQKCCVDILDYSSSTNIDPLISARLPQNIISGGVETSDKVWMQLKGFAALDTDFDIILLINSQKFQAGTFRVVAYPLPDYSPQRLQQATNTGQAITQLPGVNVDIHEQAVIVAVDRIGPFLNYSITNDMPVQYFIGVYPVSHLNDQGNKGVKITVYAALRNARPIHSTPIPPAIKQPVGPKPPAKQNILHRPVQYKREMDLAIGSEATEPAKTDSISKTLGSVAQISDTIGMIPGVQEITAPISAFAHTASGIAKSFGMSKPDSEKAISPLQPRLGGDFGPMDGEEIVHHLGTNRIQYVDTAEMTGTHLDEMAIKFVAGTETLVHSFYLSASDTADTYLHRQNVSPTANVRSAVRSDQDKSFVHLMSSVCFITTLCRFIRTDMVYRFKAVIVEGFQQATVNVGHVMFSDLIQFNSTPIDINRTPHEVWKIDEFNELEYTVPYGNQFQWKETPAYNEYGVKDRDYGWAVLFLQVNIPLAYAESVEPHIEILLYERAGENLEIAAPKKPMFVPAYYKPLTYSKMDMAGGLTERKLLGQPAKNKGGMTTNLGATVMKSHTAKATCNGESLNSLLQFMKRKMPYIQGVKLPLLMSPNGRVVAEQVGKTPPPVLDKDWISNLLPLWMFRTGGINLTVDTDNINIHYYYNPQIGRPFSDSMDANIPRNVNFINGDEALKQLDVIESEAPLLEPIKMDKEGLATLSSPHYSVTHCFINEMVYGNETGDLPVGPAFGSQAISSFTSCPSIIFISDKAKATTNAIDVYRTARDDFRCFYYLGVPGYLVRDSRVAPEFYSNKTKDPVLDGTIPKDEKPIFETGPKCHQKYEEFKDHFFKLMKEHFEKAEKDVMSDFGQVEHLICKDMTPDEDYEEASAEAARLLCENIWQPELTSDGNVYVRAPSDIVPQQNRGDSKTESQRRLDKGSASNITARLQNIFSPG